ncbi:MAG: S-adenosylmethionine decarboxylase [Gemmatimonadetes bacterium]|nr:S-adenosylmethionine decarboxylase [Gemmatimonadota bacterium]
MAAAFRHVVADFTGVSPDQASDTALLTGLLIAAAGAAGYPTTGAPVARTGGGAHSIVLFLDGCHLSVHAHPARGLVLLDILADARIDPRKALAVFTRKLRATDVRVEEHARA